MKEAVRTGRRDTWHLWWPFVLLCALRGSRWMLSEALPASSSTLLSEGLGCGSAAALCLLLLPVRDRLRGDGKQLMRCGLGGALMLAGPLLALARPGTISGSSLAMALALTPVPLAVINAAIRHTGETLPGRLWPGLAAIAGLLLLLAEPSLANPGADIALGLIPVLTACGAALFCSVPPSTLRLPVALGGAAAVLGVAALVVAVVTGHVVWPEMSGLSAGLDALEAFLSVLALGRLSAARWSAQFALVPLLILVEGVAIERSPVPARVVTGLMLLAVASARLLVSPVDESQFKLRIPQAQAGRLD